LRVELAQRLAVDVALWDQLGCLSPIEVFAVDRDASFANALGEALAGSLAHAEKIWPRGSIDARAAHAVAQQRAEAELRRAAGRRVSVYSSDSTAWTVVVEDAPAPRAAPLHRFVRVVPVRDVEQLLDALRPRGAQLAAVAIEGFGAQTRHVAHALARLGASRICEPGALQSPPLSWRRAGRGVLAPLARFSDIELPA
ncbi:MAG TPA: acyl-CoA reductase, partial [Myxococcota bacterium]|nr:acyl-CoA reductase [Myxococcota bacterium]